MIYRQKPKAYVNSGRTTPISGMSPIFAVPDKKESHTVVQFTTNPAKNHGTIFRF